MTLTTPSPQPAARNVWPTSQCVRGQTSEPLKTTVLPQASGMAIERTPRATGAFQGATLSTTPTGFRNAIALVPAIADGMTSPQIAVVIAAASLSIDPASAILKRHHSSVAPISADMASIKSAFRASISSAAALRRARRSPGPNNDHAGNAAAAEAAAAHASSTVAATARVATAPVRGLTRSKVRFGDLGFAASGIRRSTSNIAIGPPLSFSDPPRARSY